MPQAAVQKHVCLTTIDPGRLVNFARRDRFGARTTSRRHRHLLPYAALVLRGRYTEAGEQGRWHVSAGDVLLHESFDAHWDAFGDTGAEVLNLALPGEVRLPSAGRVEDPDEIVRVAEKDRLAAAALLLARLMRVQRLNDHWADELASQLWRRPDLHVGRWGLERGIRPAVLSRKFHQIYGVPPVKFRNGIRARKALHAIVFDRTRLAAAAFDAGFSDQSHMTRELRRLTGRSPGSWQEVSH